MEAASAPEEHGAEGGEHEHAQPVGEVGSLSEAAADKPSLVLRTLYVIIISGRLPW